MYIEVGIIQNKGVLSQVYFYDTVVVKREKGKEVNDTVWHKIKPFKLKNQFGKEVGLDDLNGKIVVANFFFTSCPSICPKLTRNMKRLQDAFKKTDTIVRFVSFTVDPERDSVQKIKAYGDKLIVIKVDADQNPETIAAQEILGLPTILFFHKGQLVHRQTDELNEADLQELVTSLWPDA